MNLAFVLLVAAIVIFAGCGAQNDCSSTPTGGSHAVQAPKADTPADIDESPDYDPWESFNERTFWFNHDVLDRYALKPVAKAWNWVFPVAVTRGLKNALDNLDMPPRFVNDVLQLRFETANREVTRFLINSTIGIAGVFDVAKRLGLDAKGADMGQTLAIYGVRPGPYLVVPFFYPFTVRDAIGYGADTMMDPLGIFLMPLAASFGLGAAGRINERAVNIDTYEMVEESSLDLYAAVRNGYLQRRVQTVSNGIMERYRETKLMQNTFSNIFFLGGAEADENICQDRPSRRLTNSFVSADPDKE